MWDLWWTWALGQIFIRVLWFSPAIINLLVIHTLLFVHHQCCIILVKQHVLKYICYSSLRHVKMLTNCMKYNLLEANRSSADEEIPHVVRNLKVHKSLPLDSIVGHTNVVHSSEPHSCEDSNKLLHCVNE